MSGIYIYSRRGQLSFAGTAHGIHPAFALLLDQLCACLQQLCEGHLADVCVGVLKVIREYHLVYVYSCHSPFDALVEDLWDELVGSVQRDLDTAFYPRVNVCQSVSC